MSAVGERPKAPDRLAAEERWVGSGRQALVWALAWAGELEWGVRQRSIRPEGDCRDSPRRGSPDWVRDVGRLAWRPSSDQPHTSHKSWRRGGSDIYI